MTVKRFDLLDLSNRVGGNREIIEAVIRSFRRHTPDYVARIRRSLTIGDLQSAKREAHGLKGAAATVGAEKVRQLAECLERRIEEGRTEGGVLEAMDVEMKEVLQHMERYLDQGACHEKPDR